MSYPHPSAIKTIIQTPVPVISPVILDSGDNEEEVEKLKSQVDMLLDQYRYVYSLYDELKNSPIPEDLL